MKEKEAEEFKNMMQTIHSKNGMKIDQNLVKFQEKADSIVKEEEMLIKQHMRAVKEDAELLTNESNLIQESQSNMINRHRRL